MCIEMILKSILTDMYLKSHSCLRNPVFHYVIHKNEIGNSLDGYHYPSFTFEYILYFNFDISYDYHIIFLCGVVHVKY